MSLKPFLIDVPVRVNIWIRPFCQRQQFEVLRQARPSIIFLQSDGGRNEKEWNAIRENRKIFDNEIDWECTVYKLYEDSNLGMYAMGKKVTDFIWNHVDRCVFLEDDYVPAVSFFQYCAELLEKYKDDTRINVICGMNHIGVSENVNSDYFFSRQGSIWGTATWKRVAANRDTNFEYAKDPYVMNLLKKRTSKNKIFWRRLQAYSKSATYEGHVAGGEFFYEEEIYAQNQLQIIPKYNLISNIGCDEDSVHATNINYISKSTRRIFNMKTYELTFPLKHPKYVIPDVDYEKKRNRVMAYNMPFLYYFRRVEDFFLLIRHGKFRYLLKKINNRIGRPEHEK